MGDSEGSLDSSSLPTPSLADIPTLIQYIRKVSSSILEEDDSNTVSLISTLNDNADTVRKFSADPIARSLFIQKISNRGDVVSNLTYHIRNSVTMDLLINLFIS